MKMEIMYPRIIIYVLVIITLLLFIWRKKKRFRKGVMVANTKYVKKTKYYKHLFFRYRIYNFIIKVLCIGLIVISAILTSRIYKENKHEEIIYNRDIMLCMDVSGSVFDLDSEIIDTFIDIVKELKDERFGISVFDNTPVTILPLTNDYDYAISVLKTVQLAFDKGGGTSWDYRMIYDTFNGAYAGEGASLIGDGLAYCASTFKKDDDRTKIVIFTTDNELNGKQIISVPEAAAYSKKNNVKVYPIGTKTIKDDKKKELVDVANTTGGAYYDYKDFSTVDIANKIEELNKTAIIKNVYITKQDLPEVIFAYLLYLFPVLIILDWRVRI